MPNWRLLALVLLNVGLTAPILLSEATFAFDTQVESINSSKIAAPILLCTMGAFYASMIGSLNGEKTSKILMLLLAAGIAVAVVADSAAAFITPNPIRWDFYRSQNLVFRLVVAVLTILWWGLNFAILRRAHVRR